jgi:hypothetical protein
MLRFRIRSFCFDSTSYSHGIGCRFFDSSIFMWVGRSSYSRIAIFIFIQTTLADSNLTFKGNGNMMYGA